MSHIPGALKYRAIVLGASVPRAQSKSRAHPGSPTESSATTQAAIRYRATIPAALPFSKAERFNLVIGAINADTITVTPSKHQKQHEKVEKPKYGETV